MMKEVEAGNVEYLCIKDMSRMGRDYLKEMCIRDREEAEASFRRLGDYQDANEKQELCKQKHDEALRKKKILNIAIYLCRYSYLHFHYCRLYLSFASLAL